MIDNDLSASLTALIVGLAAVIIFMGSCLGIAIRTHKLTVVDTAWGLGFILVALTSFFTSFSGDGAPALRWILLVMTALWGGRLAWHLHRRNAGKDEDPRYTDLADRSSGSFARIALSRVLLPQGIAMFLVATPLMVGMNNETLVWWLLVPGIAVWALGLFFEAVGDRQLAHFKSDPANKGKLMDQGLWRYTRHPNYFGDACVWWGIWLTVAASWAGLATIIGPIAMTVFLTKVTGAALNEKGMKSSRPGYEDYMRRTSGFIPMPPKTPRDKTR